MTTDNAVKGKDKAQDVNLEKPPEAEQVTPREDKPEYLTKAQAEGLIKRTIQLDRAQRGWTDKALKDREAEIQRLRQEYIESIKEDPAKLDAYTLKQREREVRERDEALVEKVKQADERLIKAVAKEAGVDYDELLDLSGGDPERAERLAMKLKPVDKPGEKSKEPDSKEDTKTTELTETPKRMTRVSGKAVGSTSGKQPTLEELRASTPAKTAKKVEDGEWILPGWVG